MNKNSIRLKGTVVIAERPSLIGIALKEMLAGLGAKVHATPGKEGLQALLLKNRISLVIADHTQLFKDSMDELLQMIRDYPDTAHLVLTSSISKFRLKELNNSGIRNIALKTDDRREILIGVRAALAGRKHYSREVLDLLLRSHEETADWLLLTPSELEIISLSSGGLSDEEISLRKQVGVRNVIAQRKRIYRKLGVSDSLALKRFAIKAGLIDNIEYHI